jgi:glucan-binding YG repeat protein
MAAGKILTAGLLAAALLLPSAGTAYADGALTGWAQTTDSRGNTYWSYYDRNGECLRSTSKTIDGELYFFDEEGRMLTGWITEDGEEADDDSGDGYRNGGIYYCGEDDGKAVKGWKYISVYRENGAFVKKWFYFKDNGKKVSGTSITEEDNGNRYRYHFDDDGIMSSSTWLNADDDPELKDGKWIEHVPAADQDPLGVDKARWYFEKPSQELVKNQLKKIDGKTYLFDRYGIMRTGLVAVSSSGKYVETIHNEDDGVNCDADDVKAYKKYDIMYFDEKTGARKSGKVSLTFDDGTRTLMFHSSGTAVHGVYEGKLYDCGVIQSADKDMKYEIKTVDDKDYLVSTSGTIQKAGRYKGKDGTWWTVVSGSSSKGYEIEEE